jgi:hypothetical protein
MAFLHRRCGAVDAAWVSCVAAELVPSSSQKPPDGEGTSLAVGEGDSPSAPTTRRHRRRRDAVLVGAITVWGRGGDTVMSGLPSTVAPMVNAMLVAMPVPKRRRPSCPPLTSASAGAWRRTGCRGLADGRLPVLSTFSKTRRGWAEGGGGVVGR